MRIRSSGAVVGILVLATACASNGRPSNGPSSSSAARSAAELAPISGSYFPTIDPTNFVGSIDNPFWPLAPGTTYTYDGVRGHTPQTDVEVVTHQTKRILGIDATVVRDTVSEHGHAVERTLDWYAQDRDGNVWYLGEDSFELQNGRMVKATDSWESGVDGAQPGIIMPADPQPGEAYRQEYYPTGEALDEARVLSLNGMVEVPAGTFGELLVTSERSPLEPQTEQKYYARGVGEVEENVVKGHHEIFRLVSVTH